METANLNQTVYFKRVLTSNESQKLCCVGGQVLPLFPEETKVMILFKMSEDQI